MKKILLLTAAVLFAIFTNAQSYQVKTSHSVIKWTGKKVAGSHNGKINQIGRAHV